VRQQRIVPLLKELEAWMRGELARLSRHADVAKAFDYMLPRWPAFIIFLHDGPICQQCHRAGRCVASGSAARHSISPVRTAAASAPPSSTDRPRQDQRHRAPGPARRMHPAKASVVAYRHQRTHMGPIIVSSHRADRDALLRGDNDIDDRLIGLMERVV